MSLPTHKLMPISYVFLETVKMQKILSFQNRKLMPKFVLKEMEVLYIEEMNAAINKLKANLESVPVQQGKNTGSKIKFNKLNKK
jgi:hypothetical protein